MSSVTPISPQKIMIENTSRPLVVGHISLSFHAASAAVVRTILERSGVSVQVYEAPHEQIYEQLAQAKLDMVVSAWLPGSHGTYIDPIADRLERLCVLYEPYALWGVPDYVPLAELSQVAQLRDAHVVKRMNKRIQGIGPGAGISRFSREIIAHYDLAPYGYEFHNGTLSDCVSVFEQAYAQKQWCVVPLWHPQYLHHFYQIRELEEPMGLLRGVDQATLVVRKEALPLVPAEAIKQLRHLSLGNAVVAQLDHRISVEGIAADQAASDWLASQKA
jgi:glycine betaine/proline transport system substrate-binding protein